MVERVAMPLLWARDMEIAMGLLGNAISVGPRNIFNCFCESRTTVRVNRIPWGEKEFLGLPSWPPFL